MCTLSSLAPLPLLGLVPTTSSNEGVEDATAVTDEEKAQMLEDPLVDEGTKGVRDP